jgi:N-acetyl-alpha-D-muramate 1-phosphate uridylyltransferase
MKTDRDRPKRAMVLAAGLGKRMRPITATTPKPLVEVAGKSLIDHGLDRLAAAGIDLAVVNVHYLADLVEHHVLRRAAPRIAISDERDQLLDTGGGILKALHHFDNAPFILLNSDSFWIEGVRPNLDILIESWNADAMDVLLMVAPTVRSVGYTGRGDFTLSPDGRLTRRAERAVAPFVYAGAAVLHPRLFETAVDGAFSLNRLFDEAIERERLYGARMEGTWFHVGTPDAIQLAEMAVLESAA